MIPRLYHYHPAGQNQQGHRGPAARMSVASGRTCQSRKKFERREREMHHHAVPKIGQVSSQSGHAPRCSQGLLGPGVFWEDAPRDGTKSIPNLLVDTSKKPQLAPNRARWQTCTIWSAMVPHRIIAELPDRVCRIWASLICRWSKAKVAVNRSRADGGRKPAEVSSGGQKEANKEQGKAS